MKITEGYMPFLGHQTYYRIAGECRDGKAPLPGDMDKGTDCPAGAPGP